MAYIRSTHNTSGAGPKRAFSPTGNIAGMAVIPVLVLLLFMPLTISAQSRSNSRVETWNKPVVALRTNLLYDAVLVPNIGIEVGLPMNFTIGADWFGTWLSSNKHHIYWQGYGGYLTLRYYFGKQAAECPFTGHHVGLYGSALTYDIELGGNGYQADKFGFGGGVEYGYSLPAARNLCIDFNIGVGFQGGKYEVYTPAKDGTGHYIWLSTHRRRWWGPTKVEISLKWLISPVQTKKKGGKR